MIEVGQPGFLHALGWAILNSFWQMALLWVVYQLITWFILRKKHAQKSALANILLVTGFIWFVFTFFSILNNSTLQFVIIDNAIAFKTENERLYSWLQQLLPAAAITYIVLLIFSFFRFWKNYRYLKIIRNKGLKKINAEWKIFTRKMATIMGIKKPVTVWLTEFVTSPVTIGFLKPVILVPIAAINNLTTQQLEALLLHELTHIRRHDYLINLLINGIRTILYFNPFVSLFVKSIERDREKSCDEMVIQFQNDPHGYATALLHLEKANYFAKPLTIAASGNKFDLLHRIEMILGINKEPLFSFNKLAGLFVGMVFAIGLNAILIINKPGKGLQSSVILSHFSSPFISITDELLPLPELRLAEINRVTTLISEPNAYKSSRSKLIQHPKRVGKKEILNEKAGIVNMNAANKNILHVNFTPAIPVPLLKHYQEIQVRKASDESKRVLEDAQWKAVEKNIADVFTKSEKEKIKSMHFDAFENYDWQTWENKIRQSYYDINWENINETLDNAIYKIKLDSLQNVYSNISVSLESLIASLNDKKQSGIPDTGITISSLEEKNTQVKYLLNKIKGLKSRKIIHL